MFHKLIDLFFDGCWHDWETLDRKWRHDIEWDANGDRPPGLSVLDSWYALDRVCLKCGKRDNQIEEHRVASVKASEDATRRKEAAIAIINKADQ